MARIVTPAPFLWGNQVAENSLDVSFGDPITLKSGFVDLAVAGDKIEGYSVETNVFDADNQTVKQERLEFARSHDDMVVEFAVTNGTIAQANVGSTYDLASDQTVDGATAGSGDQLILREVLTSGLGLFVRNK